jgi:Fe-S-cluster containining protein
MLAFVLSFHASYACRRSTACCTAPWAIAVDEDRARRVDEAVDGNRLQVPGAVDPRRWRAPAVASSHDHESPVLGRDGDGPCVFLDRDAGDRCALHHDCGHDALPVACQQFPRVTLADDRGFHVTLSHFCHTVAALTFDEPPEAVSIVTPPDGFAHAPLVAGLDARGHWPPLLRPGVMCSLEAWSRWEAFLVEAFGNADDSPFVTLGRVVAVAERLRAWPPGAGGFDDFAAAVLSDSRPDPGREVDGPAVVAPVDEWTRAWSAVPRDRAAMPAIRSGRDHFEDCLLRAADEVRVHGRAVGRYLAARAFASWCAYQGSGLRSHVASLRTALGVLMVEVARALAGECEPTSPGAPTGSPALLDAMRRADWLLVHLADSGPLARCWSLSE